MIEWSFGGLFSLAFMVQRDVLDSTEAWNLIAKMRGGM